MDKGWRRFWDYVFGAGWVLTLSAWGVCLWHHFEIALWWLIIPIAIMAVRRNCNEDRFEEIRGDE